MKVLGGIWWVALATLACAGRSFEAPAPASPSSSAPGAASAAAAADPVTPATDTVPAALPDSVVGLPADSADDRKVLEALAELEFRGTDARPRVAPDQVRSGDVTDASDRMFGATRGGAAGSAATTYDINVAAFANHARVQYYVDFFLGEARDRFAIWLSRLPRYEGMIRERLRAAGVPEDMVYLALIESGLSNTATSRARAAGMWQFMAGTGRRYGLSQDAWLDERRDPFKATEAAARHLADLNDQFGSWYLAAAAYNAGPGRVERGLRQIPNGDDPSDATFFELSSTRRLLRPETRDYVPKLIAAALIAKNPARYGFDAVAALPPLEFDEVRITDATGLDVLARLADTTTRTLAELNPQFIRGVTPPKREVLVRVPFGTGADVARRWAELPASERVSFIEHRVRRGETLSGIAQRYRIPQSLLQAANPRVKARSLQVGQRLTIPLSSAAQREARGRRAPAAAPVAPRATYHTVRAGDSLWVISRRYGVPVADLRSWNGLSDDMLQVGRRLRVAAP